MERVYLDWNATAPLRPEAQRALQDAARARRQSVLGPCRGPRRPAAHRAGARGGGGAGRRAAGRRDLHLERHRSQHAGADARDRDRGREAAARPAVYVGDRASFGARRRPVSARGDRGHRRRGRRAGRPCGAGGGPCPAKRPGRWSRSCSPTTRPAWCSRSPRPPTIVHAAGGLLHVDAVQAAGRIPCDIARARRRSVDAVGAQDRRRQGRRRPGARGRGHPFCRSADPRRRPGARAPRRHRECRRDRRLRRGRRGGARASWRARRRTCWRCGRSLEAGLRAISPQAVIFGAAAERLPNTTLFALEGMKAETAVIAFDLEGVAVSVRRRLLVGQGAALPCPCRHGGFAGARCAAPCA